MTGFNVKLDPDGIAVNNTLDGVFANATEGATGTLPDTQSVFYAHSKIHDPVSQLTTAGFMKWRGAALAKNQNMYFCPFDDNNIAIYDALTETMDATAIPVNAGSSKYYGFVLAKNDKIYGIPYDANDVLVLDTKTHEVTYIPVPAGSAKFAGGCLDPLTNKIYCAPHSATYVLIIDPETGTVDTTSIAGITGIGKFSGICASPNGKLYCIPYEEIYSLIIDTATNTVDDTTIAILAPPGSKWSSAAVAANGKIYCAPESIDSVLVIDTNTDTHYFITNAGLVSSYFGACFGPNNNIYLCASTANNIVIIDTETDGLDLTTIIVGAGGEKWSGICLDHLGNMVLVPQNDQNIVYFSTGIPTANIDWCISAYRNKL